MPSPSTRSSAWTMWKHHAPAPPCRQWKHTQQTSLTLSQGPIASAPQRRRRVAMERTLSAHVARCWPLYGTFDVQGKSGGQGGSKRRCCELNGTDDSGPTSLQPTGRPASSGSFQFVHAIYKPIFPASGQMAAASPSTFPNAPRGTRTWHGPCRMHQAYFAVARCGVVAANCYHRMIWCHIQRHGLVHRARPGHTGCQGGHI